MLCVTRAMFLGLLLGSYCLQNAVAATESGDTLVGARPNILLIVADDLGYSDLGSFGGEINTKNLDSLAGDGLLLTNFYAAPTCSPSRAMLLSGIDSHRVGLGTQRYYWSEAQKGRPGYEGYLNNRFVSIATHLRDSGYHTYMVGKWHLGYDRETYPSARGFDETFALLEGGASHFDQRGVIPVAAKANYRRNGKPVDLPVDFFSSAFFTDTLIDYIEKNREDGKPFFAYAAYTAPHWPLQAPERYIRNYRGVYDAGYEIIAKNRLDNMKALGIMPASLSASPGPPEYPQWRQLSSAQKRREARLMEVYAGMVEALDDNVGRLLAYLQDSGQLDNTLIVFMSDNGAEGNNPMDITAGAQTNEQWINDNFDNSLENIGRAGSYVSVGPGWARVSSTPFRLFKGFTSEGGIRVPAFIYYPKMELAGRKSGAFLSVKDIAPTLMELAGIDPKIDHYQGRKVLPMQGKSMLAWLQGKKTSVHGEHFTAAWELFGRRAIRQGDWKMVYLNKPWGNNAWQLYNLAEDLAEMRDLSKQYPDKVKSLTEAWQRYVDMNNMVVPDHVDIKYTNGIRHYQQASVPE